MGYLISPITQAIILIVIIITVMGYYYYSTSNTIESFGNPIHFDQTVVINLDKETHRYNNIRNQCKLARLHFAKFRATDGKKLNINNLKQKGVLKLQKDSFFNHNKYGRSSLSGSIGCALTHQAIWKKISKSQKNTLILEDDIILPKDFQQKFDKYSSQIPGDWDIIFLGGVRIYGSYVSTNVIKAKQTKSNKWNNCGLYAYILKPQAARKLLAYTTPLTNYLDIQMNRHYNRLKVYYLVPTIIKHNFKLPSTRNLLKGSKYYYSKGFINSSKKITVA